MVKNNEGELILTRQTTGWRVCIDYRKLNYITRKDHFPLPFIYQILEKLAGQSFYCFLDGYSSYNQIPMYHEDQEKTMLHAHWVYLFIRGCLFGYVMHLPHFKDT